MENEKKNENTQNDTNIYLKLIDKDRRRNRKQNELNMIKEWNIQYIFDSELS